MAGVACDLICHTGPVVSQRALTWVLTQYTRRTFAADAGETVVSWCAQGLAPERRPIASESRGLGA